MRNLSIFIIAFAMVLLPCCSANTSNKSREIKLRKSGSNTHVPNNESISASYDKNTLIIRVSDYNGSLNYTITTDVGEEIVAKECLINGAQTISISLLNLKSGSYILTITAHSIYVGEFNLY